MNKLIQPTAKRRGGLILSVVWQKAMDFVTEVIGSLYELQTQLIIAQNLAFIPEADFKAIYESSREIERMLSSLISKVGSK